MNNLIEPLNEDEQNLLDTFLLHRVDDDAETEVKDEGIFEACTLDGFLTAVVSGPVTIQPSRWLPVVWGDFEPLFMERTVKGKTAIGDTNSLIA